MLSAPPLLANARRPIAPGMTWVHLMASKNFAFGNANDQLTQICCPGVKAIELTGRELRRSKERRTAVKAAAISQPKAKGFS